MNNQIEKAVEWWTNVICNPKFDNGDKSQGSGMASLMANMLVKEVTEEQKEKFKIKLTELLQNATGWERSMIDVDYHPCKLLSEAMSFAEINENNAPWKTTMWLRENGKVEVSYGYGAKPVEVK